MEEATKILESEGVKVEKTKTTPKKEKKPRDVWHVFSRTNEFEQISSQVSFGRALPYCFRKPTPPLWVNTDARLGPRER